MQVLNDGRHIDRYIPRDLRRMFYKGGSHPVAKPRVVDGYDPYGFSTNGLVLYLPLWALKDSSFKSVDAYGHLCTVANATVWTPTGHIFDGAESRIAISDHASIQNIFDGGGSVIAWIYAASGGEHATVGGQIFSNDINFIQTGVSSEAAGKVKLKLYHAFSGDDGDWITTATEVTINTWTLVALTYDCDDVANNPLMYVNGVSKAVTETTPPTGTRTSDTGAGKAIGNRVNRTATFDGTIGEVFIYNRILAVAEILHNYNCTVWRYQ